MISVIRSGELSTWMLNDVAFNALQLVPDKARAFTVAELFKIIGPA